MTSAIEVPAEAWSRRGRLVGEVDFTMMYVAHDAFGRDLARLINAAAIGQGLTPAATATWVWFREQLHTHHTAEDTALWPRLASVVTGGEAGILAAMEAEHAMIDPMLARIDATMGERRTGDLLAELTLLAEGLSDHMKHEEEAALPLLERRLGVAGWDAFTTEIRRQVGGVRGGARYLPWVLDGAMPQTRTAVLGMLPPPARVLYRTIWERRYRTSGRLTVG